VSKPLLVVESPTKVRTLKKFLGNAFNVVATVGHIKDLPPKEIGIDIEKDFKPKYKTIPNKQKVISALKKAATKSGDVYLAPDPDREGEAIAWHAADVLKKKGRKFYRVLFHELTQKAVKEAIAAHVPLDKPKYEAQQTRRILDRLVGYQISPLLWRKVKQGLSAGRVQSVTVRIICERERAIQAFEPQEYWSVTADLESLTPPAFVARLVKKNNKKLTIPDEKAVKSILAEIDDAPFVVQKVQKKTVRRNPLPPFTTSKLQQEAINRLRFSAKKAMIVAQQLYEGIDLGPGEPVGLITYMRTDSVRISAEAAQDAQRLIQKKFGPEFALTKPRFYKNKNKVQDGHEAIRPTAVFNTPETLAPHLTADQLALYTLIWKRFVASQMAVAQINRMSVAIAAGSYIFNATGSSIKFPGFMTLYLSVADEMQNKKDKGLLPDLETGQALKKLKITPKQHFTMPPPRFSEASLVKELEENGIGRPSTYAAILSTIREKAYVDLVKGYFRPTELGYIVVDLLVASFPDLFDVAFTAKMENDLDLIATAEVRALEFLKRFYEPYHKELERAADDMLSVKGVGVATPLSCPQCQSQLHIKVGKNGPFLACNGYPECTYSRNYTRDEKGLVAPVEVAPDEKSDQVCEKCGQPMMIKDGRFGKFLACNGYPECKNTRSLNSGSSNRETGVKCPEKDCNGDVVEKTSRRGKIFYGCNRYPECDFALWDKPVDAPCPKCDASFLVEKTTKKAGTIRKCHSRDCDYKQKA
jgi:DNA topoisomerase I